MGTGRYEGSCPPQADRPIRLHLRSGARQPLFTSSSYLVRPFREARNWDLAQVRFRRRTGNPELDFAWTISGPGSGSAQGAISGEDWTRPTWVQFPPSALFGADARNPIRCSLSKEAGKLTLSVTTPGDLLPAGPDGSHAFRYYLLLTQPVTDFRGRSGQWTYVKILGPAVAQIAAVGLKPPLTFEPESPVEPGVVTRYEGRLLEVQPVPQVNDDQPSAGSFWEDLFDGPSGGARERKRYRIVRVSPPFPIKKAKSE